MRKIGYKLRILPKLDKTLFLISGCIAILSATEVNAQGNLLISPRRIVFEGEKRTQELNLANTGKDTAKYLISMVEIRMKDDGSFEEIKEADPGQNFASKYMRFFPRSVTLAPNEAQTVKVQLNKTGELAPGEYRSHIYFRAIPNAAPLGDNDKVKDSSITVKLTPVFGITIPAIIRIGESTTQIKLSNLGFEMIGDTIPRINLTLNRTGNMSAYGDIVVEHVSANGKTTEVGIAKGVAIYSPNSIRHFHFNLDKNAGINFKNGKLHVSYVLQTNDIKAGMRSPVMAEEYLALP